MQLTAPTPLPSSLKPAYFGFAHCAVLLVHHVFLQLLSLVRMWKSWVGPRSGWVSGGVRSPEPGWVWKSACCPVAVQRTKQSRSCLPEPPEPLSKERRQATLPPAPGGRPWEARPPFLPWLLCFLFFLRSLHTHMYMYMCTHMHFCVHTPVVCPPLQGPGSAFVPGCQRQAQSLPGAPGGVGAGRNLLYLPEGLEFSLGLKQVWEVGNLLGPQAGEGNTVLCSKNTLDLSSFSRKTVMSPVANQRFQKGCLSSFFRNLREEERELEREGEKESHGPGEAEHTSTQARQQKAKPLPQHRRMEPHIPPPTHADRVTQKEGKVVDTITHVGGS